MHSSSGKRFFGRLLVALFLLGLIVSVGLAAKRKDPKPIGDKDKPWYKGRENLEKYFVQKGDLPTAPLLDYSQDCMLCHNLYYEQWWNSGHSQSYNNQFFQDAWQYYREWWLHETSTRKDWAKMGKIDGSSKKGMHEQPERALAISKTDCLSCHAPSINATIKYTDDLELRNILLAMREGYIPEWEDIVSGRVDDSLRFDKGSTRYDELQEEPSLDIAMRKQVRFMQRISDYTKDGISCDFCHTVTRLSHVNERGDDLHRMHNLNYSLNFEHRFGMKKWGSIEETPTASHTIQFSPVYKQSEFCASCHQAVNDFGVKVMDTYNEWKYSQWARDGITCQNCHMPEFRSVVSKHGPERSDAHNHSMLGVGDLAFMQTAADVEVEGERYDDYVDAVVRVINNGTGHSLPTGKPFRRLVLVVRAEDESGTVFWDARQINAEPGYLSALPDGYWKTQGDYPVFQRVVGSSVPNPYKDGEEVPFWSADYVISDTRLKANETREFHFRIPVEEVPGSVFVSAQLFYRQANSKFGEMFNLADYPVRIAGYALEIS
ncbi:MAG: hypothetical protein HRF49_11350 [bacterium]|jgi:hypothetical protein